jgi:hypothetical protein
MDRTDDDRLLSNVALALSTHFPANAGFVRIVAGKSST